jgi:hypothetical protein
MGKLDDIRAQRDASARARDHEAKTRITCDQCGKDKPAPANAKQGTTCDDCFTEVKPAYSTSSFGAPKKREPRGKQKIAQRAKPPKPAKTGKR